MKMRTKTSFLLSNSYPACLGAPTPLLQGFLFTRQGMCSESSKSFHYGSMVATSVQHLIFLSAYLESLYEFQLHLRN